MVLSGSAHAQAHTHACVYMASLGVDVDEDGGLEESFKRAAERMRQNTALVLSNEAKLELYGFFKQVKAC